MSTADTLDATQTPHPAEAHQTRLTAGQACLEAALAYHARGFSVVCCCDPDHIAVGAKHGAECDACGKVPMHAWKTLQAQPATPAAIRNYWKDYPIGNVGLVLGQVSGLVRVDVDGPAGESLLQQWSAGDLPPTWIFRGSLEGRGLLFAWDKTLPCQTIIDTHPGFHRELRLMGNGSQTIVPPSRHPSGRLYAWEAGCSPEDLPLAPAPAWLVTRMTPAPRPSRAPVVSDTPDAAKIASALDAIPNEDADYDTWMRLGMALQSTGEDCARDLWDTWSLQSTKFNAAKQEKSWQSFYLRDGGVTIGTLYKWAREFGWKPPRRAVPRMDLPSNGTHPPDPDADEPFPEAPDTDWRTALTRTKGGEVKETFANMMLALQHLAPWDTGCWYDLVREIPMCGTNTLSDEMEGQAALDLERHARIPIRTLRLVHAALVQHCRATPRDELQEWLSALPPWDLIPRLTHYLCDHAGAEKTAYGQDVARLLPVSMVARALDPGCQYRNVIVLEGAEDIGKSKLVKALASPAWYRELSHGLEGKEAHMILQGVWVAELAELSSLSKTEDARLKSFITMETDDYIPKFANGSVSRKRRTIFVGTVNPEGDGAYLRGQTGNTRFLPLKVRDIQVADVLLIREQLFAEALVYYRDHPTNWWQLSEDGQTVATQERDARRQGSVYEDSLRTWLLATVDPPTWKCSTTWEEIAEFYLRLEAKEKWKDKGLQMEVAKALHACGWTRQSKWDEGKTVRRWVPPSLPPPA